MLFAVAMTALGFIAIEPGTTRDDSVEAVCEGYPERVKRLFAALDLERPGLESVKTAVAAEDWPAACTALLEYYRTAKTSGWLRKPPATPGTDRVPAADTILDGTFSANGVSAKVPRRPDGGPEWAYNGPNDDREWGWGLNRHHWVGGLLGAYQSTGNPVYVQGFERLMRDWITSNPYPGEKNSTPQWRGLEVFSRVAGAWPGSFFALQDVPEFTPATRILMLSSIPDHAHYGRHFHAGRGNWITMELLGLATAAICWPEFKEAGAWFDYATTRLLPEMAEQVYADGVQKELTSHYHRVALRSFERFMNLARRAGRDVPAGFRDGIERMYNYLAYAMRPTGYGPLNNDSNLDFTRREVLARVDIFDRPDWAYIATNGQEGEPPEGPPSVVFPWAGQVIMRSGWDADAHWAFFDVGPLGIGHWHYDKLHLSVAAFGRDILVDAGRYTYKGGDWRRYFVGSRSHNVILIDGAEQQAYARQATEPLAGTFAITPESDVASGVYDGGYSGLEGTVTHTRTVLYCRGTYWVVVDRIATDRPRTIQPLWHFHPDCTVAVEGTSVVSVDEDKGNVRIAPASTLAWDVTIVQGQTDPHIQGWWSREYNSKEPSPCAVYAAPIDAGATFAWVIVPGKGNIPKIAAEIGQATDDAVEVRVLAPDAPPQTVTVPMNRIGEQPGRESVPASP